MTPLRLSSTLVGVSDYLLEQQASQQAWADLNAIEREAKIEPTESPWARERRLRQEDRDAIEARRVETEALRHVDLDLVDLPPPMRRRVERIQRTESYGTPTPFSFRLAHAHTIVMMLVAVFVILVAVTPSAAQWLGSLLVG